MRTLATKQPNNDVAKQKKKGNSVRSSHSVSPLSTGMPLLQRKCACGGGCPRCKEEPDKSFQELPTKAQSWQAKLTPSAREMHSERLSIEDVHQVAAQGISSAGHLLPYFEQIQKAFGESNDMSRVKSHVGNTSTNACKSLGVEAYAVGENVAFKKTPDLYTSAHEAAHVVQQRNGIRLKDGVGRVGDGYERHADAVADRVVQGKSARSLLNEISNVSEITSSTTNQISNPLFQSRILLREGVIYLWGQQQRPIPPDPHDPGMPTGREFTYRTHLGSLHSPV